ncbi:hypothetical protein M441DRAFT_56288, partial [Trichoderma asperellum CBS 433.97]
MLALPLFISSLFVILIALLLVCFCRWAHDRFTSQSFIDAQGPRWRFVLGVSCV